METLDSPQRQSAAVALIGERARFSPIARESGYTIDALMFMRDAVQSKQAVLSSRQRKGPLTTSIVREAVVDYVAGYFNDREEAADLLAEWRIRDSSDVGRIIDLLLRGNFLQAAEHDSGERFGGLFTLADLLAEAFE